MLKKVNISPIFGMKIPKTFKQFLPGTGVLFWTWGCGGIWTEHHDGVA